MFEALPDSLFREILSHIPPLSRLSLKLLSLWFCAVVRSEVVLRLHLSCAPTASSAPAILPPFVRDGALSCRIRIGVTSASLSRLAKRLQSSIELLLLAFRRTVASAELDFLRLEDFKRLAPVR